MTWKIATLILRTNVLKFTLNLSDYLLYFSLYFAYVYSKNITIDIGITNHNDIVSNFIIILNIIKKNNTIPQIANIIMIPAMQYVIKLHIDLSSYFDMAKEINNIATKTTGTIIKSDLSIKYALDMAYNNTPIVQNIATKADINVSFNVLR